VHDESTERSFPNGALYLVVSGAPAPEGAPTLVRRCQEAGWRVVVFSTPAGTRFIDVGELEQLTGEPVRSEYRLPGTGKPAPAADAVLACPLTFNSVNKFAHGHADNFAVGLLCEADLGRLGRCPVEAGGCGWLFLDHSRNRSRRLCRSSAARRCHCICYQSSCIEYTSTLGHCSCRRCIASRKLYAGYN